MKNTIIAVVVLFLMISCQQQSQQPNIIFILADDMGYSDMSWQGSPIQTPNLDNLREGGMFLERNYVQPQCTPSRVAFLTGNYPYRYGLHEHIVMSSSYSGIPGEAKTVAEKMKEAGYNTSIIGKWHVGGSKQSYLPHNQGFDHSFVCINGAISYWNYTHAGVNDLIRNGEKVYPASNLNSEASGNKYSTYMWSDEAVDVINQHNRKQPLFMYLSFTAPHHPLNAPQNLLDKYPQDDIDEYWSGSNAQKGRKAQSRKYYMAMVDAMDMAIGDIIEAVEKNGMKDNTMIVFCSDNGGIIEADNRPFRSIKGDSFEGGVRVPGIVYWPGRVKAASSSSALVHMCDWYPTFAEIAGIPVDDEDLDGISALNILKGGEGKRKVVPIISAGRHALISENFSLVGSSENYQQSVNNSLLEFQLYNLDDNISQKNPTNKYPEVKKEMQQQFIKHFTRTNRGSFNWDIKYARYRKEDKTGNHNYDFVINDLPAMNISRSGKNVQIIISPVSDKLTYKLQGSYDGRDWKDMGEYVCRVEAEKYKFPLLPFDKNVKEYRLITTHHFGLPVHDGFSFNTAYHPGPVCTNENSTFVVDSLPYIDGFLPIADISGGKNVQIIEKSLAYKDLEQDGGALQLSGRSQSVPTYFTRYFIEPISQGKIYTSMLVKFEALEAESIGEINFLVQNGWNGPTEKQVSIRFQNDGIYFHQADPSIPQKATSWLAAHDNKVVFLVFEFELGSTGQDEINIYINPENKNLLMPTATYHGEFTFDRLQYTLTGRTGGLLTVDEIKVGRKLEDVIHIK